MGRISKRQHRTDSLTPQKICGQIHESIALDYLVHQGLTLKQRNFHCALGEIDLVMLDHGTLVFVEVRYRENQDYGLAHATVTTHKQRKIIRAASYYLQKNSQFDRVNCRFDVVGIDSSNINWIKDAFQVPAN